MVHFHDICWPFEYPEDWIANRGWNEAYALMNFLQFNDSFKIIIFNSFLVEHEKQSIMDKIPEFVSGYCGSIWIERMSSH